ncbi:hypothetical protein [Kordia sp.]|uniref:hypothetical protein n=1 Tax=Kordia sp. TaxID=1965332 RepID=UPI003D6B97ED
MKPSLTKIDNFPYQYFQYGSKSSTDIDVIIVLPKAEMPSTQEERKRKLKQLKLHFQLDWNAIFVVIEDGILVDTIYTKSWIDSLNNAFYHTHKHHEQLFKIPVTRTVKRNKTLAIYKAVRTILTMLTRTHLRTKVRPIIRGIHPFQLKLEVLKTIDFSKIESFNQKNTPDADAWKIIAFYLVQNELLITQNIEVYSKEKLLKHVPEVSDFILRKEINLKAKNTLTQLKNKWLQTVIDFGDFKSTENILSCNNERVDMVKEIGL